MSNRRGNPGEVLSSYPRVRYYIIKGIERSEEINLSYRPLEEKWNVKCLQADVFPKAVLDLVR